MAFARRSLRSFHVLLLQRGNAAFAAWTALSRPSFWVSVTFASSSPVTGSEIFIALEESILWPFTIFGDPAVRRAIFSACSRLDEYDKKEIHGVMSSLVSKTDRDTCLMGIYQRTKANATASSKTP